MKDVTIHDPLICDLEALIDEVRADPARANEVKQRLRRRLAGGTPYPHQPAVEDQADLDAIDLWDNLPL